MFGLKSALPIIFSRIIYGMELWLYASSLVPETQCVTSRTQPVDEATTILCGLTVMVADYYLTVA